MIFPKPPHRTGALSGRDSAESCYRISGSPNSLSRPENDRSAPTITPAMLSPHESVLGAGLLRGVLVAGALLFHGGGQTRHLARGEEDCGCDVASGEVTQFGELRGDDRLHERPLLVRNRRMICLHRHHVR